MQHPKDLDFYVLIDDCDGVTRAFPLRLCPPEATLLMLNRSVPATMEQVSKLQQQNPGAQTVELTETQAALDRLFHPAVIAA